jgi:hypothetical protein
MMLMLKSSQSLARKAMLQSSLLVSQHSTRNVSFISGAMMHPAQAGAVNPVTTISAVYAVFMGTVIFHVVNEATATTASR